MHRRTLALVTTGTLLQLTTVASTRAEGAASSQDGHVGSGSRPSPAVSLPMGPLGTPSQMGSLGSEPPASQGRHWYGEQILAADAAALVLFLGVSEAGYGDTGRLAGSAAWAGGGPVVHFAHDRPSAAVGSLAMRSAALLVAWAIGGSSGCQTTCTTVAGSCADDPNGDYWHTTSTTCSHGNLFGAALGILLATTLDSALLARDSDAVPTAKTVPTPHRRLTLDNVGLLPTQSGAAVSLGGHF
jgi:hypothetical protein